MQEKEDFQILCAAINLVIKESRKPSYLPEWLYNFWRTESSNVDNLTDAIKEIAHKADSGYDLEVLKSQLIKFLDHERYVSAVHMQDKNLRSGIQEAMLVALFFSNTDVKKYQEFVIAEQAPEKFISYLNKDEELDSYKSHLKKQQSLFGRFIKNFTDEEITLAARGKMINGKLFEMYSHDAFLEHGFHYIKKELKALQINKIELGFLTHERINSYIEKISFLMHPANELHQNEEALIKNARYILEDIINTAGIKEAGVPNFQEHAALIHGCYWVDELFKVAYAHEELSAE